VTDSSRVIFHIQLILIVAANFFSWVTKPDESAGAVVYPDSARMRQVYEE